MLPFSAMVWSMFGVKSSLITLLLLAIVDDGMAQKFLSSKPEIGPKNILVILPIDSPSHRIIFSALTDELLERGHYVTMVVSNPGQNKHPRKREILTENLFQTTFSHIKGEFFKRPKTSIEKTMIMYHIGVHVTKSVLSEPKVLDLKKEKFDLVITEAFFFQEAMLAFAHHFGCPSMALSSFGYYLAMNDITGGSVNPAYVVNIFSSEPALDTLLDRLRNTLSAVFSMLSYHLYYYPKVNAIMHDAFPNAPPLYDLLNNLSLTLISNNDALMFPVPLSPSVIQVGGVHIKPGKPLPTDLKKWVEESKEGIVYFSFGSNLKVDWLPTWKQNAIISSLGKLKQRVLLKWNAPIPENAPPNCRFEDWVPQQEILAHPKLLVFVTHGGLLSVQESVYNGAPIIVLPVFGDQSMNAAIAVKKGIAVSLSIFDFSPEAFDAALAEVVNNPKYREQSRKLKDFFRSDPVPPLEKAVHYTELLMSLGSLKQLQPSSVHLSWYQYLLLDVAALILVCVWVTWWVIRFVCGKCIACCRRPKPKED